MSYLPVNRPAIIAVNHHYAENFRSLGFSVLEIDENPLLPTPVAAHADMNMCFVDDKTVFVSMGSDSLAYRLEKLGFAVNFTECQPQSYYPDDVQLNCAVLGRRVLANISTISKRLYNYFCQNDYELIGVKQGYTKCSTFIVNEKSVISADKGICEAAEKAGIAALKISEGNIQLDGYDYGFIGGSSGMIDKKTALFCGDICKHPDYIKIERFLSERGVVIQTFDGNLTDVGSFLSLVTEGVELESTCSSGYAE